MRLLSALLLVAVVAGARAEENKLAPKISGYLFGDYSYMIGAAPDSSRGKAQFASTPKDAQQFQIRRMYFTYDQPLAEKFAMQMTLESTDSTLNPGGRLGVYLKTAFVEWKELFGHTNFRVGLVPTLTWTVAEKVWNYRSLEKTIADMRAFGQPVDLGVTLRGAVDAEGAVNYGVFIGNGLGSKPETNKYKKFAAEVNTKLVKNLTLQAYGDFEPAANDVKTITVKGLAAWNEAQFNAGVEFVTQTQAKAGIGGADITPTGLSLFVWAPIPSVENLGVVVRYDMFDKNSKITDNGYKENFLEFAIDYTPVPNVHLMPNLWMNSYSPKGSTAARDADMVGRVTFFYIFR
jgi:hypothetical protein